MPDDQPQVEQNPSGNSFDSTNIVEKTGYLHKDGVDTLYAKEWLNSVTMTMRLLAIIGTISGLFFAILGICIIFFSESEARSTEINLFGQSLSSDSIGVSCIFIGAMTVLVTIRRVLKSFDVFLSLRHSQ